MNMCGVSSGCGIGLNRRIRPLATGWSNLCRSIFSAGSSRPCSEAYVESSMPVFGVIARDRSYALFLTSELTTALPPPCLKIPLRSNSPLWVMFIPIAEASNELATSRPCYRDFLALG